MNVYEIVTDRILQMLKDGVVPWRQPWVTSTPKNLVSKKPYRGVNIFLLGASRFASSWWVTYKQATAKGGQVRKGEKSTPVIFWKVLDSKKKPGEKTFILRYYNAFNVTQCDNLKYPEEAESTPFNPIQECEQIVSGYANAPSFDHNGSRACYAPAIDHISMPVRESFAKVEEYYSTLFHEMTHSTGAQKRLDRKGITDPIRFASHDYSFEELIAECGAAFLCSKAGIENRTLENSAAYIASWCKKLKDEPKWIVDAAASAAKASDHILGIKYSNGETVDEEEVAA